MQTQSSHKLLPRAPVIPSAVMSRNTRPKNVDPSVVRTSSFSQDSTEATRLNSTSPKKINIKEAQMAPGILLDKSIDLSQAYEKRRKSSLSVMRKRIQVRKREETNSGISGQTHQRISSEQAFMKNSHKTAKEEENAKLVSPFKVYENFTEDDIVKSHYFPKSVEPKKNRKITFIQNWESINIPEKEPSTKNANIFKEARRASSNERGKHVALRMEEEITNARKKSTKVFYENGTPINIGEILASKVRASKENISFKEVIETQATTKSIVDMTIEKNTDPKPEKNRPFIKRLSLANLPTVIASNVEKKNLKQFPDTLKPLEVSDLKKKDSIIEEETLFKIKGYVSTASQKTIFKKSRALPHYAIDLSKLTEGEEIYDPEAMRRTNGNPQFLYRYKYFRDLRMKNNSQK